MIKLVDSKFIDLEKLAVLRKKHSTDPFCQSYYFNAVCDNFVALVLNDYQGILLVPYRQFGPWRWALTPLFYRYSQWLGCWSTEDQKQALELLAQKFKFGDLNLGKTEVISTSKIHQELDAKQYLVEKCNSQARRMIRKAEGQGVQFTNDLDVSNFISFLDRELSDRVEGMTPKAMAQLKSLLIQLNDAHKLHFEGAIIGGELIGGILIVEVQGRHLYLKGTATNDAKRIGVYYLLMHRAILRARKAQVIFDFGGSEVDGVARFNRNFGAYDMTYSNFSWGNKPYLYGTLKRLRTLWKSKSV